MDLDSRFVRPGGSALLSGRVSGLGKPKSARLIVRTFPYKEAKEGAVIRLSADGTYALRVKPALNTRYKVLAFDPSGRDRTSSKTVKAVVLPKRGRVQLRFEYTGKFVAKFFLPLPRSYPYPGGGKRVSWYLRRDDEPVFRRFTRTESYGAAGTDLRAFVVFPPPSGRYNLIYVTACVDFMRLGRDPGIGLPARKRCPDRFRA